MKTVALVLALSLSACAPVPVTTPVPAASSVDGVHFTAERVASGRMRLALDNGARHPIGYNLCTSALQRRDGASWTNVETGEVCTMQVLSLNPGFDATFEKQLPAGLAAGEYRYQTSIESPLGTAQTAIATPPFEVR